MCNAIAGTAVISSAKILMSDIFGTLMPAIVTGKFLSPKFFVEILSNIGSHNKV
jgi:hypothetical protein